MERERGRGRRRRRHQPLERQRSRRALALLRALRSRALAFAPVPLLTAYAASRPPPCAPARPRVAPPPALLPSCWPSVSCRLGEPSRLVSFLRFLSAPVVSRFSLFHFFLPPAPACPRPPPPINLCVSLRSPFLRFCSFCFPLGFGAGAEFACVVFLWVPFPFIFVSGAFRRWRPRSLLLQLLLLRWVPLGFLHFYPVRAANWHSSALSSWSFSHAETCVP